MPDVLRRLSPTLLLGGILGALLLGGTLLILFERYVVEQGSTKTDNESLIVRSITADDHIIGKISAPIQIVVYADLSCRYCKSFFDTSLPKLQEKYGNSIVVAFRHLPLPRHPKSRLEANAAECVNQLGGDDSFWSFVHAVYAHKGYEEGLNLSTLAYIADEMGVPGTKLSECVRSGTNDTRISADALEASIAGISQTPGIVLKSATRALIVKGNYYSQLDTGISYLLESGF